VKKTRKERRSRSKALVKRYYMIFNTSLYPEFAALETDLRNLYVLAQRTRAAWTNLTEIAAILRDSANFEVWTESPSDRTQILLPDHRGCQAWRVHFANERAWFVTMEANKSATISYLLPQWLTAVQGYITSTNNIAPVFASIMNAHKVNGRIISEPITQTERNTLATAIEAELQ